MVLLVTQSFPILFSQKSAEMCWPATLWWRKRSWDKLRRSAWREKKPEGWRKLCYRWVKCACEPKMYYYYFRQSLKISLIIIIIHKEKRKFLTKYILMHPDIPWYILIYPGTWILHPVYILVTGDFTLYISWYLETTPCIYPSTWRLHPVYILYLETIPCIYPGTWRLHPIFILYLETLLVSHSTHNYQIKNYSDQSKYHLWNLRIYNF